MMYAGRDKEENEELIKYGWPEDIWFHVDKLSSAHIYIRLPDKNMTINDIPPEVIHDCCQLVKNRSIEGCKATTVDVVFTPWSNLKKTGEMAVGQVGFFNSKLVTPVKKVKKDNETVKRLEKSCQERFPNLRQMRQDRDMEELRKEKIKMKQQREEEERLEKEKRKEQEIRNYTGVFTDDAMVSNTSLGNMTAQEYEEDFL